MTTKEQILEAFSECDFSDKLILENIEEKILPYTKITFDEYFTGATKAVFLSVGEKYVIKIPFSGRMSNKTYLEFEYANGTEEHCWDYCYTEVVTYHRAKKAKVEKAFAKETLIGYVNNYPIYIQEKVDTLSDTGSYSSEEDEEKTSDYLSMTKICYDEATLGWYADALNYYGSKQFDKIIDFIEREAIGDLHAGNLGYIGSKPVLCDYSDYND